MNAPAFGRGTTLGIVLFGALAFVALLYWLGNGGGPTNNGGGHAGGRGLNGFAALAAMLDADGIAVDRARGEPGLTKPGLLILTPPADADGAKLAGIVDARRHIGPTLVVTPKWTAVPEMGNPNARRGWTKIVGTQAPDWKGFRDDVTVEFGQGGARGWEGGGRSGALPQDATVLSGSGTAIIPLVKSRSGRTLAGFVGDEGFYPDLNLFAGIDPGFGGGDQKMFPLVFVFEPDLLDNWGLAQEENGLLARDLVLAAQGGGSDARNRPVTFDLTLNGLGATRNLLTLAFEPPFLAATLCLLMAMLAAGWRAFNRFGPPWRRAREIPLGKTTLVANSAGLIRRAGRLHLIAGPYADAARERVVAAIGLPRGRPAAETDAAIDAVRQRRGLAGPDFTHTAARLAAARRSADVAHAAADLQRIEKELVR